MRDAFVDELTRLAVDDKRIAIVAADIGNRMFDRFKSAFPGRFFNTGIAEATMTGIAAGLSMAGLRPFTYTIAAFNPGRCVEQIRLDVCQHNLPVTVVGTGGGLSYASLGPTHHALEDIAWLRPIPNMTILCPGDSRETRAAVRGALAHNGPVYLRLGKKGEPDVHSSAPDAHIGKAIRIGTGDEVALLAVGTVLLDVVAAAEVLARNGIAASVYSLFSVKPLDEELLDRLFATVKLVGVIEEHARAGGAWSAVAEWLAGRRGPHARLIRFGPGDVFLHEAGDQQWTRRRLSMDGESIARRVLASW